MLRVEGVAVDNQEEAEMLLIYHLRLAAQLFEATGLNLETPKDEFSSKPMAKWVREMEKLYPDDEIKSFDNVEDLMTDLKEG